VLTNTIGTNTRVAGTAYYISPEQTVVQGRIDHRSDIYSLGVVLYQMLCGRPPFEADTESHLMDLHRTRPPVPLGEDNQAVPQAVESVVLKALAKRPEDRYQSAKELARAFRLAAQQMPGAIELECFDMVNGAPVAHAAIYINGALAGQTDQTGIWRQAE